MTNKAAGQGPVLSEGLGADRAAADFDLAERLSLLADRLQRAAQGTGMPGDLYSAADLVFRAAERLLEVPTDEMRWHWLVRHSSLGFDSAPSWNAVIRLPVFDSADHTITALVDRAIAVAGERRLLAQPLGALARPCWPERMTMDEQWLRQALKLVAEYALCKGALDIAHVLGDAKLYDGEKDGEKKAWDAMKAHLQKAIAVEA